MDVLGIPTVLVPPNPGNVSAFGLLTVDVKNDYVQTHVALADALDAGDRRRRRTTRSTRQAADALAEEGFAPEQHRFARTADLRYFGQAFEVRVPVPEGDLDAAALDGGGRRVPRRAPRALRLRLLRRPHPAGRVGEPPGLRHRADPRPEIRRVPADGFETATSPVPRPARAGTGGLLRRGGRVRRHAGRPARPTWRPGTSGRRPGDHRGVRLDGAAAPGLRRSAWTSTSTSS